MDLFESWIAKKRIAHRGYFNDAAPENTLAAFRNAIENDYAIETDVRMLDDGTLVVFNDETLGRLTNRDGYVAALKKENLAEIRVGKTEERIPTLQEALETIGGKVPVLIQVINHGAIGPMESALIEMLNHYDGEFAVQSFNPATLEYFKINAPHIFRGQLACRKKTKGVFFLKRQALSHMRYNRTISCPHFISYDLHDLPNPYVAKYRKKIPILAWTVKSNDDFERVKSLVDNFVFENKVPQE